MRQLTAADAGWYVPGSQSVHVLDPVELAYVPGEQSRHALDPVELAYLPGEQLVHAVDAVELVNVPTGHGVQSALPDMSA